MIDTFSKYSWTLYYLGTQTVLGDERKDRDDLIDGDFILEEKRQNRKESSR